MATQKKQSSQTNQRKYLIETSAIPPALGQSTPKHRQHFQENVTNGTLYTSYYIRMEFIRRWVFSGLRVAFAVEHFGRLDDAR